jgi:hypothetical protein
MRLTGSKPGPDTKGSDMRQTRLPWQLYGLYVAASYYLPRYGLGGAMRYLSGYYAW